MRTITAVLALALASGAAAAPERIEVGSQLGWSAGGGSAGSGNWWAELGDPALEDVLQRALAENGDIQAARSRVQMASGAQVQGFSPLVPNAAIEVGLSTGPYNQSLCQQLGSISALSGLFDALAALQDDPNLLQDLDFGSGGQTQERDLCTQTSAFLVSSWQLDIFGRNSMAFSSRTHELKATKAETADQVLMLTTAVAQAWYDVVLSEQQVAVIEQQLQAQSELLELVELRYEQGGASGLDVLQQRQQVASTQALLPTARAGRDARLRNVAALTGRSLSSLPDARGDLPETGALPGVGTPEEITRNRPDLAAAYQRTLGARDARTSAQTNLLPTLTASARAGWTGFFDPDKDANGLLDVYTQNPQWGAGLTLRVPLFNGGLVHGGIRQARAAESMAVSSYNQRVLSAVAEVDGAIRMDEEQRIRRDAVRAQAEAAQLAYDESVERYLAGLDSYLAVLAAQASDQAADLALLQARRDALGARIQLYDALGRIDRQGEVLR